jgi:hypothetical protein
MMRISIVRVSPGLAACRQPADAVPTRPTPASPSTEIMQGSIVEPTPYGPMLIQQGLPPPYRDYQMNRVLQA